VSETTVLMARNWSSLLGMAGFLERVAGPQCRSCPRALQAPGAPALTKEAARQGGLSNTLADLSGQAAIKAGLIVALR